MVASVVSNCGFDQVGGLGGVVVFPGADDNPACGCQALVGVGVAGFVRRYLGWPVPAVGGGPGVAVLGAAVPEAAVDVHRDPGRAEDDVGAAPQAREGLAVHAVAQAPRMQMPAQGELGGGVAGALELHPAADARRGGIGPGGGVLPAGTGSRVRPPRHVVEVSPTSQCCNPASRPASMCARVRAVPLERPGARAAE
jgi:hypothetical protein